MLKKLEGILSNVDGFKKPKINYEQYPTSPHLTSRICFLIQSQYKDINGKSVLDLGCGTGMLSIGVVLCGAKYVIGYEIDSDAIKIANKNIIKLRLSHRIDLINMNIFDFYPNYKKSNIKDIKSIINGCILNNKHKIFDTCIMNPPFGTKNNNKIDVIFLITAIKLTKYVIYSFHKTSTINYLIKFLKNVMNVKSVNTIYKLKFDINKMYKFHKQKSKDIQVSLIRIEL